MRKINKMIVNFCVLLIIIDGWIDNGGMSMYVMMRFLGL